MRRNSLGPHKGGISPEWEYWAPSDPEIEELLDKAQEWDGGFARVMGDHPDRVANYGMRFGRGNPDSGTFCRLGPSRPERPEKPKSYANCCWCKRRFERSRESREFCSTRCSLQSTAAIRRDRPTAATCRKCQRDFRPGWVGAMYCSRMCHANDQRRPIAVVPVVGVCPVCRGPVGATTSKNGRAKVYCSVKCKKAAVDQRSRLRKMEQKGRKIVAEENKS